ncbi:MAG TPA: sulfatase-like hydrolase/transferase [Hyphomicrobiales bacterium]|nr:sulfatase-like hydrolase/transferase [Hyphomicrobiales bacterium]
MSDDTPPINDRRRFLKTSVAAAGLAGLSQLGSTEAAAAPAPGGASPLSGKPNILIIMTDEQRFPPPYESATLAEFRKTYLRAQEELRQNGIEFKRHYTASVACAPSRGSFFTGHYPSLHGVANTDGSAKAANDPDMFWLAPDTVPTLGNYFRTAGYRTLYKGKWHISEADLQVPGTRQSVPSYDDDGNRDPENEALYLAAGRLERYGFTGWIGPEPHGTDPMKSASSARGKKGRDEAIASQAVELLAELDANADDTPWLMVCSLLDPHDITTYGLFTRLASAQQGAWEYNIEDIVPEEEALFDERFRLSRADTLRSKPSCQRSYWQTYRKSFQPTYAGGDYYRLYYQLHKNVDEQIGKVYDQLKRTRFFDNTIVVFTSDHGDMLGAHGGLHQKWYTAYDEALHVPLIVSHPAWRNNPSATDMLTSHVDILPTLLGLAGLDGEGLRQRIESDFTDARPLVGKDISPVIRGQAVPDELDSPVYFMTDDDPSRGLNQQNLVGLSYASVTQPNHIESVITRLNGSLWKYSRYFDNPQYWSSPGTPGQSGVQDAVAQEVGNKNEPGTYPVTYRKQLKTTPEPEEFELYNLSQDAMELVNLAGRPIAEQVEAQLKTLLAQQSAAKRLSPISGVVPGQDSGDGTVEKPETVENTRIPDGSRLENVLIGSGTTFGEGVELGANVRFAANATIPAGLVLTGALNKLPWIGAGFLEAIDLSGDVVVPLQQSLLRAIQQLDEYEPAGNEVWQDPATGELSLILPDSLSVVLPVAVFQAKADQAPGTYVNDDGDIHFVTHSGRVVVARPMVADRAALMDAGNAKKLSVEFDEEANILLLPPTSDHYYVGRPFSAVSIEPGAEEGLSERALPDLANVTEHVLVFREGEEKLMQQALVPRPADWPALKALLLATPAIEDARIDTQGIISVKAGGSVIRGRASAKVAINGTPNPSGRIDIKPTSDRNGDGVSDYLITYPNGDTQVLYVYS